MMRTTMNKPPHCLGVAVLDAKMYAVGGTDGNGALSSVECVDPSTGQRAVITAAMNTARASLDVTGIDGELYVPHSIQ